MPPGEYRTAVGPLGPRFEPDSSIDPPTAHILYAKIIVEEDKLWASLGAVGMRALERCVADEYAKIFQLYQVGIVKRFPRVRVVFDVLLMEHGGEAIDSLWRLGGEEALRHLVQAYMVEQIVDRKMDEWMKGMP